MMTNKDNTKKQKPNFFLSFPPELTSLILLEAGPEATMVLKSVNKKHATLVRNLEANELCRYWVADVKGEEHTAPPFARKVKITTKDFEDLFTNVTHPFAGLRGVMRNGFVPPTDCRSSITRSGNHRLQVIPGDDGVARKLQEICFASSENQIRWTIDWHTIPQPLPSTLTVLRFDRQSFRSIDRNQLPATLQILEISGNILITNIGDGVLPESLFVLVIQKCPQFKRLEGLLPSRLNHLDLSSTRLDLACLANLVLPGTLRKLNLNRIVILDRGAVKLPTLPDELNELHMACWTRITHFPYSDPLPSKWQVLNLSHCRFLRHLCIHRLPSQLHILNLSHCRLLPISKIPQLPSTVLELDLSYTTNNVPQNNDNNDNENGDHNATQPQQQQQSHLLSRLPPSIEILKLVGLNLTTLPLSPTCSQLRHLDLINNLLQELPSTLPNALEQLDLYKNQLAQLPKDLPSNLLFLRSSRNNLTELPAYLPQSLRHLYAQGNQLKTLPTLPPRLEYLAVHENQLYNLPLLTPSIKYLYANNNRLTQLPLELPAQLVYLYVHDNRLRTLPPLPETLQCLYANDNRLTKLPLLPSGLTRMDVYNNRLTELPPFLESLGSTNVPGICNLRR